MQPPLPPPPLRYRAHSDYTGFTILLQDEADHNHNMDSAAAAAAAAAAKEEEDGTGTVCSHVGLCEAQSTFLLFGRA